MVKKHIKPNSKNPKGGIEEKESPIHISNVSLLNGNTSKGSASTEKKTNITEKSKKR